ncbi:uncharacterized protein FOMMEDRAFT_169997 [Fomitiporia mediterranea MF3/22]|uniref:uncharacterized protein n=1 Tax=Fomitiporia mediterranea (strain MF3/22) TaxID=694068 RepID=UPI0004408808|nr:uncharacterized protein FOMMEDRAFT_169997 [Fomitiporia mediterranea MF3/22]EJD00626.1 hypothetical protein FOMMEDRAFT_169997 [Fomitiporia mediterranea MF3/22]
MFRNSLSLVRREGLPNRFSLPGGQTHPSELMVCHELAASLMIRFQGQGTVIGLEEAVELFRRLLELYHGITPHYFVVLSNFAGSLHASFLHSGRIQELNEAIELYRCSISVSYSDDWRLRPGILSSFANALISRFHHYGRNVDLHETIILYHTTVNLLPEGDSRRARLLEDLAHAECALDGLGQDEIPNNANPAQDIARIDSHKLERERAVNLFDPLCVQKYREFT